MPSTGREKFVHIAAGCIENARGEILICQRPAHKIYPGEWEFPGGKLEEGESAEAALRRELGEELGIVAGNCHPLIRLRHVYPEISVDLDVWKVMGFRGELRPHEHPKIAWVAPDDLPQWQLLAADRPIVNALRLPGILIVTPPAFDAASVGPVLRRHKPALFRLRLPGTPSDGYRETAQAISAAVRAGGGGLIVDRDPGLVASGQADGFHATSAMLETLRERPVDRRRWFGASCHDADELEKALALGADYVVLGPVKPTGSHPNMTPLGWKGFEALARDAGVPAYAIGGLAPVDLEAARAHGARGIAGISAFWKTG